MSRQLDPRLATPIAGLVRRGQSVKQFGQATREWTRSRSARSGPARVG